MATLTATQIRLRTGGYRNTKGKMIGGYSLPADIRKDLKAGIVDVVPNGRFGIKIRATKRGKKVISARLKRDGLL